MMTRLIRTPQRAALAIVSLFLSILFSQGAAAQTVNTTVTGVVKDPAGALIQGAKITLTDVGTKLPVNTTSNSEGFYLFNEVRSGYYTVSAEANGFKRAEIRDVKVD